MEGKREGARGSEAFPRRYRLGDNRNYRHVYRKGKAYPSRNLVLIHLKGRDLKIGFSVSGKVGKAVTRNRVRRCLREDVRRMRLRVTALPTLPETEKPIFTSRPFRWINTRLREGVDLPLR